MDAYLTPFTLAVAGFAAGFLLLAILMVRAWERHTVRQRLRDILRKQDENRRRSRSDDDA